MIDMQVKFAGLTLQSPIIAGSSGLSRDIDKVKALAKAGVGAVILPSLFEEQIDLEINQLKKKTDYTEGLDMLEFYEKQHAVQQYLEMIKRTKEAVDIPVIASINCFKAGSWIEFANQIAVAGADALEVNIFYLSSDPEISGEDIKNNYFAIAREVVKKIDIPVILKVSNQFDNVSGMLRELSFTGISGLVLFNRFYSPDIDIEKIKMTTGDMMSSGGDLSNPLRWIAIMEGNVDCDLCSSTGVKNGGDVIKMLLAGANAVQIVGALYKGGADSVSDAIDFISGWMQRHNYASIAEFRGKLSQKNLRDGSFYERVQFIKYFSEYK